MTKTANLTQIGVGSVANDGTGDTLREAFIKTNDNFSALYQGGQFTANVTDSKSLPGIAWQGEKNTGFYHPGTGQVGVALNGQEALLMTPSKITWKGDEIASHVYVDAKFSSLGASTGLLSLPVVDALPINGLFDGRLVLFNGDNQTYLCLNNAWIPYKDNIIANGPSGFEILNSFPTDNLWEGRTILRTSDTSLYVRRGSGWIRVFKYNTPAANGISAIDVVTSLPTTGNFNGREALFNDQAYIHNGTAWVSFGNYVSTSTTAMQVVSVAPTTGLVEGKVILLANTLNKSNANAFVYIDNKFQNLGNLIYIPPSLSSITADSVYTAAIQDLAVSTAKYAGNSVTNEKLANLNITNIKIADNTITSIKFANSSITSEKLAPNAVTSTKLAEGSVSTGSIVDGSITSIKIAAGNVTTAKIADLAVTNEKIALLAIGNVNMSVNSVITSKIQDGSVTRAKLSTGLQTAFTGVQIQKGAGFTNSDLLIYWPAFIDKFCVITLEYYGGQGGRSKIFGQFKWGIGQAGIPAYQYERTFADATVDYQVAFSPSVTGILSPNAFNDIIWLRINTTGLDEGYGAKPLLYYNIVGYPAMLGAGYGQSTYPTDGSRLVDII
jgi:hypothetical protein